MKGAIIGDIIGSVYEYNNIKTKNFELFSKDCFYTDDTIMTVAVAQGILNHKENNKLNLVQDIALSMYKYGKKYPNADYGSNFKEWLSSKKLSAYNSWGNGAPMRCSAAGWLAKSEKEALLLGKATALPTHNHPSAVLAAQVTARLIYLAKHDAPMNKLQYIADDYYILNPLDEIRESYSYDISCEGTMPVALEAFLESTSFEDAIRNAVSIGGDTDTICAITGAIAEAYYGVPGDIAEKAKQYIPEEFLNIYNL